MIEGEAETVEPLFTAQDGNAFWWSVKLKNKSEQFSLHQNGMALNKGLKPGDRVRYTISKVKLQKDGSQGIDHEGFLLFEELRKIEEKEELGAEPEL